MKTGKVSQATLDRSVLRPLSRAGVLTKRGAAFGRDCAFLPEEAECSRVSEKGSSVMKTGEEVWASVCGTLGGSFDRSVEMLLAAGVNNLAASGAEAKRVMLGILFPAGWEEEVLKSILERVGNWCSCHQIAVAGGHTEVSDAISRPVFSVTVWGVAQGKNEALAEGLKPNQDLVMTGWAGQAGTAVLAQNREKELAGRYPVSIIDAAKGLEQCILVQEAARAGVGFGVSAMHDVSQGGIFAALWEMAEFAGVGLEIDLKKIPIRQETIEICEFFDLNPYQLYGQGALLLGTSRGEALAQHLNALRIPAAVIGQTTSGNDRTLRNGEDVRFLDRPAQDALWIIADRKKYL